MVQLFCQQIRVFTSTKIPVWIDPKLTKMLRLFSTTISLKNKNWLNSNSKTIFSKLKNISLIIYRYCKIHKITCLIKMRILKKILVSKIKIWKKELIHIFQLFHNKQIKHLSMQEINHITLHHKIQPMFLLQKISMKCKKGWCTGLKEANIKSSYNRFKNNNTLRFKMLTVLRFLKQNWIK